MLDFISNVCGAVIFYKSLQSILNAQFFTFFAPPFTLLFIVNVKLLKIGLFIDLNTL